MSRIRWDRYNEAEAREAERALDLLLSSPPGSCEQCGETAAGVWLGEIGGAAPQGYMEAAAYCGVHCPVPYWMWRGDRWEFNHGSHVPRS